MPTGQWSLRSAVLDFTADVDLRRDAFPLLVRRRLPAGVGQSHVSSQLPRGENCLLGRKCEMHQSHLLVRRHKSLRQYGRRARLKTHLQHWSVPMSRRQRMHYTLPTVRRHERLPRSL
ncbi:hypothetical protein Tsp_10402 [Trichinella spiralis]|uniref:hypothetical protein n=1 Tax=Trichinella spiralis TaxID=6334 RepID=UPI0001EFEC4D|nr:hypothetical protein Tsp_10402 [Trichinella spiralis]